MHGGRGQPTQTSKAESAAASACFTAESTTASEESTAFAAESTTGSAESTAASP